MTVLDILKTASIYLNIDDTLSPIFSEAEQVPDEATSLFDRLLCAFNSMAGYIFATHFDIISDSDVTFDENGVADMSSLLHSVKSVKSVKCRGRSVDYKVEGDRIVSKKNMTATITYSYLPEDFDADDDFDFALPVDIGTLAIGVAWFYSLSLAIYDDAESFKEQFLENIHKMSKPTHRRICQRRWE